MIGILILVAIVAPALIATILMLGLNALPNTLPDARHTFDPNDVDKTGSWIEDIVQPLVYARLERNEFVIEQRRDSLRQKLDALADQKIKWRFRVSEVTKTHVVIDDQITFGKHCSVYVRFPYDQDGPEFKRFQSLKIGSSIPLQRAAELRNWDRVTIKGTIKKANLRELEFSSGDSCIVSLEVDDIEYVQDGPPRGP